MKQGLPFLLCSFFYLNTHAQTDNNNIVIGKVDSVYSTILKEKRKVWVYVPTMKSALPNSGQRFPVVYLLDGDGHFESVVGVIQQLSQVNGNTVLPEMIVVGIPNTDRTRDLTPTHIVGDPPMMDSNFSKATGGGENFAAFLEKELIPHIDSAYPTQAYKTLIGHSFGGLAVMHILTNHTKMFNAYISIDPSMWYDKEKFLRTTTKKLTAQKYDGTKLYLGIANTLPEKMTIEKMKKDTGIDTRHVRSIFALDKSIKDNAKNGLKYASKYYADDDHGSVPLASEYDGLRFIFDWHRMKLDQADFMEPGMSLLQKLEQHYQKVSREFGYKVLPPESQVNGLGYNSLSLSHYDKAAALFEMNIANYPGSGNVYDSYADLLVAKKDTVNAIVHFEKAYNITKSPDTKLKLDQLQGKSLFALSLPDMEKYVGVFEFETVPVTATVMIKDNSLWLSAPGQGSFELVPFSADAFTLKGVPGYKIQFDIKDNKPVGLSSAQPNGIFKAILKK